MICPSLLGPFLQGLPSLYWITHPHVWESVLTLSSSRKSPLTLPRSLQIRVAQIMVQKAKSVLLPVFVNMVLFEHRHSLLHTVCGCFHRVEQLRRGPYGLQSVKYLLPSRLQKKLANLCFRYFCFMLLWHRIDPNISFLMFYVSSLLGGKQLRAGIDLSCEPLTFSTWPVLNMCFI